MALASGFASAWALSREDRLVVAMMQEVVKFDWLPSLMQAERANGCLRKSPESMWRYAARFHNIDEMVDLLWGGMRTNIPSYAFTGFFGIITVTFVSTDDFR